MGGLATNRYAHILDNVIAIVEPQPRNQPVVWFARSIATGRIDGHIVVQTLVEISIFVKQPAKLFRFIGTTKFLSGIPTNGPEQARLFSIVLRPFNQVFNALLDPLVAKTVVVVFDGDVVREIVRLKLPDGNVIGLQFGHLVDHRNHLLPILFFLVFICFGPKNISRDAAHSQRCQFHGFTGGIDFPQFRLRQVVIGTQLRQFATGR